MTVMARLMPGPQVSGSNGTLYFGSSHVASASVLVDLAAAMRGAGLADVQVVRGTLAGITAAGAPPSWASDDELDLARLADLPSSDLRCVYVRARQPFTPPGFHPEVAVEICLGSAVAAHGSARIVKLDDETGVRTIDEVASRNLLDRCADLIEADSRRRVSSRRVRDVLAVALGVLLFSAWVVAVVRTWFNPWAALFGALAAVAFYWQAGPRIRGRRVDGGGRVHLDPTPREAIRASRANSRRDLKVGVYTAIPAAILGAVLQAWLT
jgi:hypothetical protein